MGISSQEVMLLQAVKIHQIKVMPVSILMLCQILLLKDPRRQRKTLLLKSRQQLKILDLKSFLPLSLIAVSLLLALWPKLEVTMSGELGGPQEAEEERRRRGDRGSLRCILLGQFIRFVVNIL